MKTLATPKTKKGEEAISVALVVSLLIILMLLGALPMLAGSTVGLVAFTVSFRKQQQGRGWLKILLPVAATAVVAAIIAYSVTRAHWH